MRISADDFNSVHREIKSCSNSFPFTSDSHDKLYPLTVPFKGDQVHETQECDWRVMRSSHLLCGLCYPLQAKQFAAVLMYQTFLCFASDPKVVSSSMKARLIP